MNKQFSKKLKQMTGISRWVIPSVLLYALAAVSLICSFVFIRPETTVPEQIPAELDVYGTTDVYSSLKAQLISYEFASDFKETNHYYFVFDSDYMPYIIQLHGEFSSDLQAVQDYFYSGETAEGPPAALLLGMSSPIEADIKEFAIESYNELWGEEVVNEDNFSDYFGDLYLDTTKQPGAAKEGAALPFLLLSVVIIVLATWFVVHKSRYLKISRATLAAWPEERLLQADSQLQHPIAAYEPERLYLTDNYIISAAEGFRILPYESILRIYDTNLGKYRLMAETTNHDNATLAAVSAQGQKKQEYFTSLAENVKKTVWQKREMSGLITSYDTAGQEAENNVQLLEGMPKGFEYAGVKVIKAEATGPKPASHLIPGFIGAFGASLVGVALWILLGQIGFIAGIAGFIMLKFAIKGYMKLGGALDKKGAYCCLLVAAFMIFGANVLDYILALSKVYFAYEASLETRIFVITNFTRLMTDSEMWTNFLINLGIGFGLSIWSSSRLISALVHGTSISENM